MPSISVKSILRAGLKAMGADGLVNTFDECGCELDDLSPGSCLSENECQAAKFIPPEKGDPDLLKDCPDGYYVPMEVS